MPFLSLNNWEIDIEDNSVHQSEIFIGDDSRAFNGDMRSTRRLVKRRWEMSTTIMTNEEALALANLLRGLGYRISFAQNLYATNGLQPESGYLLTFNTSGFSTGYNSVTLASGVLAYNAMVGGPIPWSLLVWKKVGSTWTHFAKTATGEVYTNGVLTGTAAFLNVTGGGHAELVYGASDTDFADFIILPWIITQSQATAFSVHHEPTTGALFFGNLPRIHASGDVIDFLSTTPPVAPIEVYGIVDSIDPVQAHVSGAWRDNARRVQFILEEA